MELSSTVWLCNIIPLYWEHLTDGLMWLVITKRWNWRLGLAKEWGMGMYQLQIKWWVQGKKIHFGPQNRLRRKTQIKVYHLVEFLISASLPANFETDIVFNRLLAKHPSLPHERQDSINISISWEKWTGGFFPGFKCSYHSRKLSSILFLSCKSTIVCR